MAVPSGCTTLASSRHITIYNWPLSMVELNCSWPVLMAASSLSWSFPSSFGQRLSHLHMDNYISSWLTLNAVFVSAHVSFSDSPTHPLWQSYCPTIQQFRLNFSRYRDWTHFSDWWLNLLGIDTFYLQFIMQFTSMYYVFIICYTTLCLLAVSSQTLWKASGCNDDESSVWSGLVL